MKQIFTYIIMVFMAAAIFSGCHERYVTYADAEYVMFADTMAIYPVQAKGAKDKDGNVVDSTFRIPVVSTVKRNYDRTFGVEIIDKGSNAIEKKHYRLESNTITIKAGQTRADVLVHGYYSNIEDVDSLGFELSLIMNDKLEMPLYGRTTKVVMMKSCPFDINNFTGWCMFTSMFLFQYPNADNPASYQRLIYTERHPLYDNKIICRNWLNDGYDITMTFNKNLLQGETELPYYMSGNTSGTTFAPANRFYRFNESTQCFHLTSGEALKPFEAYIATDATIPVQKIVPNGISTGIKRLYANNGTRISVCPTENGVIIYASDNSSIDIYTTNGRLYKKIMLKKGQNTTTLPKGIYLIGQQKVVVK